jgi:hypothetical protein
MISFSSCSLKGAYLPSLARVRIKMKKRGRRSISTAARTEIRIRTRIRKGIGIRTRRETRTKTRIGAKGRMARKGIKRRYSVLQLIFVAAG